MFDSGVRIGFRVNHCCAANPIKNRSQSVSSLDRIVAVAAISGATLKAMYRVVIVASGMPISKGIPAGIDFTAKTIAAVIVIMLQDTGTLRDMKTRY